MRSKVIVITGGTRGLGKELYSQAIRRKYRVACLSRSIGYRESEQLITLPVDITSKDQVDGAINKIYGKWNCIDVLINNAGIVRFKSIGVSAVEDVNCIIDTNVKGTFYVTQKVLHCMDTGYILTLGSTRSITTAPNKALYSMSKFALRALNQSISQEYPQVRSTLICPGRLEPEGTISKKYVASLILDMVESSKENHIRELIIGGKL